MSDATMKDLRIKIEMYLRLLQLLMVNSSFEFNLSNAEGGYNLVSHAILNTSSKYSFVRKPHLASGIYYYFDSFQIMPWYDNALFICYLLVIVLVNLLHVDA